MRIALLADPIDNQKAGIHYYTRELVRSLGKGSGNEYLAVRMKNDPSFEGIRQVVVPNYCWIPGYKAFRMFILIPWVLRRLRADVVVEPAHFGPFNLPRRMKRVTVIHDLTPVLFPSLHNLHSQLLQRAFLKSILKRAGLLITNSEHTLRDVLKVYPFAMGRIHPIYLGIEETFIPEEREAVLERYRISKPYFLFVGTLEPRKDLVTLLRAFRLVKEEGWPLLKLVIAGQRGWKMAVFDRELEKHPFRQDIILPGYVQRADLPALYSSAVGYIQPSLYEGFGMSVAEAMGCGTPCIVSNVSSLPEIGGDAVLTFDPGDALDLAGKMITLASDQGLREVLSEKARERSILFSWGSYAREFDRLISGLSDKNNDP